MGKAQAWLLSPWRSAEPAMVRLDSRHGSSQALVLMETGSLPLVVQLVPRPALRTNSLLALQLDGPAMLRRGHDC